MDDKKITELEERINELEDRMQAMEDIFAPAIIERQKSIFTCFNCFGLPTDSDAV